MSHMDRNPVNARSPKRAAIVLSNPASSPTTGWPAGFWWSELTHPYFLFSEVGYEVDIYSPLGGRCEPDAMSDPDDASQWQADDVISRGFKHDPEFMQRLENTAAVDDLDVERYDTLVVAGGQGPMFSFERAENLHAKFSEFYATGKPNVEEDFSDQFVWDSGALPPGTHFMPWRIEDELKKLGANYVHAGLWKGFAIRDGNLITGQQNFSGAETAKLIIAAVGL